MYDSFCDWKINNQFEDDLVERIQIAGLRFDVQRKYRVVDVCLGLPQLLLGGEWFMPRSCNMSYGGWAFTKRPELIWLAPVKEVAEWVVGMVSQRVRVLVGEIAESNDWCEGQKLIINH